MDTTSGRSGSSRALRESLLSSGAVRGLVMMSGVAMLAACAVTPNLPPAPLEPKPIAQELPLPPYRIQVGDVLDVRLLLNPELNEEVTVRPDGYISTTIAHNQRAAGMTVPQLDADLRSDYSHDLQNPRVSVVVKSFAPTRVYVGGEVNNPGEFITVGPTLTLSQALARAGGTKLSAAEGSIFVIRRGDNDRPEFLSVNWNAVRHGANPNDDVRLAPYDVVYVPKLGVAEVYKWYNQFIEQFAHPSFGFSYLVNQAATGNTVITAP